MAICETAERLTAEEGEPALRQYLLVVGALRSLADREHEATMILDAFLIRSMSLAGWEPALAECAVCSAPGPHGAFNVPAGGVVCPNCRPPGSVRPQAGSLGLMAALLSGDWAGAEAARGPAPRGQRPDRRPPAVAPGARHPLAAAGGPLTRSAACVSPVYELELFFRFSHLK